MTAERFAVELDVYETHGTHAAFERDRRREEELLLAGIESIPHHRPTPEAGTESVMENLTRHLARRRQRPT